MKYLHQVLVPQSIKLLTNARSLITKSFLCMIDVSSVLKKLSENVYHRHVMPFLSIPYPWNPHRPLPLERRQQRL